MKLTNSHKNALKKIPYSPEAERALLFALHAIMDIPKHDTAGTLWYYKGNLFGELLKKLSPSTVGRYFDEKYNHRSEYRDK